jgi:hypothetical protein
MAREFWPTKNRTRLRVRENSLREILLLRAMLH